MKKILLTLVAALSCVFSLQAKEAERGAFIIYFGNKAQKVVLENVQPSSLKVFKPMAKGKISSQILLHTFNEGDNGSSAEIKLSLRCIGDGSLAFGVHGYKVLDANKKKVAPMWMIVRNLTVNGETCLKENQVYSRAFVIKESKIDVQNGDIVNVSAELSLPSAAKLKFLERARLRNAGK